MTCRRPRYPPHAHTVKCLMPVMISPRSARDSLRVPCLQLNGPHLKCTFSQHTLGGGGALETRGVAYLGFEPQQPPRPKGPAPPSSALKGKRTRAAKKKNQKNRLSQPGQVAPVVGKGSLRWERGDAVRWDGLSVCLFFLLFFSSALGIPSHHHQQPRGFVPSCFGLWGGLPPHA